MRSRAYSIWKKEKSESLIGTQKHCTPEFFTGECIHAFGLPRYCSDANPHQVGSLKLFIEFSEDPIRGDQTRRDVGVEPS